ncbi:MAG TPA: STAS domain-containing protein [Acidimicrobiales bacterium]|nr:STAS domain-containing protein [Acidimicrobiales bacterium]
MAAPVPFDVTTIAADGLVRVAVLGELDCASAPRLGHLLATLADDRRDLVVDLRSTEFVDCAGIDVIAVAYEHRRQLGGSLLLEEPSRAASRVLELTGLAEYLPTTDGQEPPVG